MAAYRERTQTKRAIAQWCTRIPVLRDLHFIARVALEYWHRILQQRVFQHGFRVFWTLTAGARRMAMATRIQRHVRSRRAQQQLVVMRTTLAYRIETHVAKACDVLTFSLETLHAALVLEPRRDVWVFALLTLPWQPLTPAQRELFATVATNWRLLRQRRMAFGLLDATARVQPSAFVAAQQQQHASHDRGADVATSSGCGSPFYSVLSWLDVAPQSLPCIAAFWQGVSTPASRSCSTAVDSVATLPTRALPRRFMRVCSSADALVLTLDAAATVQSVTRWIEQLESSGRDAAATDLQANVRRVQAKQRAQTLRNEKRDAMARRLQQWRRALQCKWHTRTTNRAALRLQRWYRRCVARQRFRRDVQHAIAASRLAARTLQRFVRRYMTRKRLRLFCASLVATPARFANAPLCDECVGATLTARGSDDRTSCADATAVAAALQTHLVLATLKCRDCAQALCTACFATLHCSGKRVLHLADRIDAAAMNDPATRMCDVCEVAASERFCATCASTAGSSDGDSVRAFCIACFERAHSDVLAPAVHASGPHIHMTRRQRRRVAWWQSERFRTHAWSRTATLQLSQQAIHAGDVVAKYAWSTLAALEQQVLEQQQQAHELRQQADEQQQRERELFALRVQHEAILRDAFDRYDRDGSGSIDRNELARMFAEELCQPLRVEQLDAAMRAMDTSGDGTVEFDELLRWFTETAAARGGSADSVSSASELLKDALRAKRAMRRYRDKLAELLPTASSGNGSAVASESALPSPPVLPEPIAMVPGFPSVACLTVRDYAAKRRVFFRFVKEIMGLAYVDEDEREIPIESALDVFVRVFVPRWNAGALTHDLYFDDETFAFDGSTWRRVWDASARKFVYCTRRQLQHATSTRDASAAAAYAITEVATTTQPRKRSRKNSKKLTAAKATAGAGAGAAGTDIDGNDNNDTWEDVVEPIDPRRRQQLYEDAKRAFAAADEDNSGYVDAREFHRMLVRELCEPVSRSQTRAILQAIDADNSGRIDLDEFFAWYAADKCQDVPVTPQLARVRAVLQTRRRARTAALAAVDAGVSSGLQLSRVVTNKLRAHQLARDSKHASTELVVLLYDGHTKALATKALALHNQNVDDARAWLVAKQQEQQHDHERARSERKAARAAKKRQASVAAAERTTRIAGVKHSMRRLLFGVTHTEAHAARVQNALANLERDIQLVDDKVSHS